MVDIDSFRADVWYESSNSCYTQISLCVVSFQHDEFQGRVEVARRRYKDRNSGERPATSFTLAAFATLAVAPISGLWVPFLNWNSFLAFLTAAFLAVATLIFLSTAMSAYKAGDYLNHISLKNVRRLEDGRNDHRGLLLAGLRNTGPKKSDSQEPSDSVLLEQAWLLHEETRGWTLYGFFMIFLALICFALEIHFFVGLFAVAVGTVIFARLPTLRGLLFQKLRRILFPPSDEPKPQSNEVQTLR